MTRKYYIPKDKITKNVDFITEFFIEEAAAPKTSFFINYSENEGFYVHFLCEESNPVTTYSNDMDPVFEDSCVEFFANFYPQLPNSNYINFEMNSNGAILVRYRKRNNPHDKIECIHLFKGYIKPQVNDTSWQVELFIPIEFIQKVYETNLPVPNHFKGNMHKCSFNDITRHAGSWNKIDSPNPNFHSPECFGDFYIKD